MKSITAYINESIFDSDMDLIAEPIHTRGFKADGLNEMLNMRYQGYNELLTVFAVLTSMRPGLEKARDFYQEEDSSTRIGTAMGNILKWAEHTESELKRYKFNEVEEWCSTNNPHYEAFHEIDDLGDKFVSCWNKLYIKVLADTHKPLRLAISKGSIQSIMMDNRERGEELMAELNKFEDAVRKKVKLANVESDDNQITITWKK
jgi:hypothetical protein